MSPTCSDIEQVISNMRRDKAAGCDKLTTYISRHDGPVLTYRLTDMLARACEANVILSYWFGLLIVPVYKQGEKSRRYNYGGISFTSIMSLSL